MAEDGHFWVDASVNGHEAPFLVDSGAIGHHDFARNRRPRPGWRPACASRWSKPPMGRSRCTGSRRPNVSRSARSRAPTSPSRSTTMTTAMCLGMNFLSSLGSWRVEGNYLVLQAMTNDWMLGSLYLLMAMMLVLGSLIARRERFAKLATMALAWIAIFGGRLRPVHLPRRPWLCRAAAEGRGDRRAGRRRPGSSHSDGDRRPFLGRGVAQRRAGQIPGRQRRDHDDDRPRNGGGGRRGGQRATATRSSAPATACCAWRPAGRTAWRSGRSSAAMSACTSPSNEDLNVLGMNYLSSLERWGVEGRWLILQS